MIAVFIAALLCAMSLGESAFALSPAEIDQALWNAVVAHDAPLVESLLRQGANPNSVLRNSPPVYILSAAVFRGDLETTRVLLNHGANPQVALYDAIARDSGAPSLALRMLVSAGGKLSVLDSAHNNFFFADIGRPANGR